MDINLPAPSNNQLHQLYPNNEGDSRSFFDDNVSLFSSSRKESVDLNEPAVSAGGFTPSVLAPTSGESTSYGGANQNSQAAQNNFQYSAAESSNTNYQEVPSGRSSSGGSQQQTYGSSSSSSGYQQATQQTNAQASNGYEQQYGSGQQSGYGSSGQSNGGYSQQQSNGGEDGYGSSGPSTSVLAQQAANQVKYYLFV